MVRPHTGWVVAAVADRLPFRDGSNVEFIADPVGQELPSPPSWASEYSPVSLTSTGAGPHPACGGLGDVPPEALLQSRHPLGSASAADGAEPPPPLTPLGSVVHDAAVLAGQRYHARMVTP
jgi:hypothetical protein